MPWPLSTILFHEENEISRKYTCDVIQAIAFSMLNFKACGTPLNIMQSSKYFAQILFIVIGTTSKGGTVKLITFSFSPLAKGHPNIYIYIYDLSTTICIHYVKCCNVSLLGDQLITNAD